MDSVALSRAARWVIAAVFVGCRPTVLWQCFELMFASHVMTRVR
jgi:hypothetical protein